MYIKRFLFKRILGFKTCVNSYLKFWQEYLGLQEQRGRAGSVRGDERCHGQDPEAPHVPSSSASARSSAAHRGMTTVSTPLPAPCTSALLLVSSWWTFVCRQWMRAWSRLPEASIPARTEQLSQVLRVVLEELVEHRPSGYAGFSLLHIKMPLDINHGIFLFFNQSDWSTA